MPIQVTMKDGSFSFEDNGNDWLSYEQLTNYRKLHRSCLIKLLTKKEEEKEKEKRLHWLLKNVDHFHFPQTDGPASLLFMPPISTFSGISAIPQPRRNTAIMFSVAVMANLFAKQ